MVSSTSPSTRLQWLSYAYHRPYVSKTPRSQKSEVGVRLTWRRPLSSRSPRSLTKTISSSDRRTRSKGSETDDVPASSVSAMSRSRGWKRRDSSVKLSERKEGGRDPSCSVHSRRGTWMVKKATESDRDLARQDHNKRHLLIYSAFIVAARFPQLLTA